MKLEILYEDNHLIAINKPSGAIVQGDKTGDLPITEQVKQYIKQKYNKPNNVFLGLPHRLDRPTSGVLLLAKTSKALTRLNKMFKNSEVEKIYWAVVDKKPPENYGFLTHYLKKVEKLNKSFTYNKPVKGAKLAQLEYFLLAKSENYYLLEVKIHTGRHHQIRSQLAAIGLHIKGDLKYGAKRSNKNGGIHLHAFKISFTHPVSKKEMTIIAKPPNDPLWNYFYEKVKKEFLF